LIENLLRKRKDKKSQENRQFPINKLDEFLKREENKKRNRNVLGWQFTALKVASKVKDIIGNFFGFIFRAIKIFVYNSTLASLLIAIIFLVSPLISAAPKSFSVTTKEQWDAGEARHIYTSSKRNSIQLEPAGTWNARSWATPPNSISTGSSAVLVDNYMYVPRGGNGSKFYRHDTIDDSWDELADMPQLVTYGGDSVYDGNGNIYYIFGGYAKYFYKYNIEDDFWTQMPELPDTIYYGAALEFDGTNFYVIRGSYTTDFWKFDTSDQVWYSSSPTPTTIYYGSDTVYHDGYLYTNRGNLYTPFWRYDIANDEWETIADAPVTDENRFFEHRALYHEGYIYHLRSYQDSTDFWRYSIADDLWEKIDNAPDRTGYGSSIQYNATDGLFYVLPGNGTYYLWKFDPSKDANGEWVGPADAPGTIGTAGDLIWNGVEGAGNYLYGTRGSGSASFYRYDVTANEWTTLADVPEILGGDIKGTYHDGFVYIPRGYDTYDFFRYEVATDSWSLMSNPPAVLDSGANAVYNAANGAIYVTRGNGTNTFYRYDIANNSWTTLPNISSDGFYYSLAEGARLISDGTNLYLFDSYGGAAFAKYDTTAGTWSNLQNSPFAHYYGTDMDYYDGKIYALAGFYKDETWEYTIATNSWRQLPKNQEYIYERGPWNGASMTYAGGNSFFATMGFGIDHMMSFTVSPANYQLAGVYTSQVIDLSYADSWIAFDTNSEVPANTNTVYETRTSLDQKDWSDWQAVNGTEIQSPTNRYIQVRITLTTTDGISTPTVDDFTITYNSEDNEPENTNVIIGRSSQVNGELLISGQTYPYEHPFFDWADAVDTESGIDGYYVYFGTDSGADPVAVGTYQTLSEFTVNLEMNAETHYLRIRTKDHDGNVSNDAWEAFTYEYKGVTPYLTNEKTTKTEFDRGILADVSSELVTDAITLESKEGFWNENRLSYAPGSIYVGGSAAYLEDTGKIYVLRGNNTTDFYTYEIETDTWASLASTPDTVANGGALTLGSDGYLFASRGSSKPTFWRYSIVDDSWQQMANAPKSFIAGTSLVYPKSNYIFAFMGGDDAMYKYSISDNRWSNLTYADFGNPNEADGQRVDAGSYMDYDGDNHIYVMQGSGYPYFAKYTINDNEENNEKSGTWTQLANSPRGITGGGVISYDATNKKFYALAGGWLNDFMSYDVESNSWTILPDTPSTVAWGASLKIVEGYVYAIKGDSSIGFYRFNIDKNSWEIPQSGFWGPTTTDYGSYHGFYYGTTLASDGNNTIYITKGYMDDRFGKYNIETGEFVQLASTPVGIGNGAAAVYNEDENMLYLTSGDMPTSKSNGTVDYFMKYDIAKDIWSIITTDQIPGGGFYGSTMTYDGERYIYMTRGADSATWKRYDTQATEGTRWSANLPTTAGWTQHYGGMIIYVDGYIYSTRGGNSQGFWRYNISTSSWEVLENVPAIVYRGASIANGEDGYIYATAGGNLDDFYRYNILAGTWEEIANVPAQINYGGYGIVLKNRFWTTVGHGSNSYNHGLYSYLIGSDDKQTGFEKYGTYTSEALDLTSVYRWANLKLTMDFPNNTFSRIATRTSMDGEDWSVWDDTNNQQQIGDSNQYRFSIVSSPARYLQYQIKLTSSDQIFSPKIHEIAVNYYQDIDAPSNPTVVTAHDSSLMSTELIADSWYNYASPYFTWPVAETVGGATDGLGGSGVVGYYVYFGTNGNVDPYLEGTFQIEISYTANNLISGQKYYLLIKAIDDAGMIPVNIFSAFTYNYDNTAPVNPTTISVNPVGFSAVDNFTFTWESNSTDEHAGLAKFQYQTGEDDAVTWFDINDISEVNITIPNEEHITGAYQAGKNSFYLRAVDSAGNVSLPIKQEYYFSQDAPSPPRELIVAPENSEINSFAFTWEQPESYMGDPNKLTYHYSVNALPNAYNTTQTLLVAAGPGPFATQRGENRFYVCAMDEAKNIDYSLYAYIDFSADTSAPGAPVNIQIFDTSDRENQEYSVALKWSPPVAMNPNNFAGYVIYRSEDNEDFTEIASTSGSAYVDTDLTSKLYYYYIKAKDSTNNISIPSTTVSITPTGRYTTPPTLVTEPTHVAQSFEVEIKWGTNRVASSFVEYGRAMSLGKTNGQVDSVTDHIVQLTGLEAGVKYYYKTKFIDPDGNIGSSDIINFETLPPPTISEVVTSDIGLEAANVSWETNTSSKCVLKYGKEGILSETIEESSSGGGHLLRLTGLESTTDYSFQINCIDEDLNDFSSDQYTFRTLEQPISSELVLENKENVDLPTVVVRYNTTLPTTTFVEFKSVSDGSIHNFLDNLYVTEHSIELDGLIPSVEYDIKVGGIAEDGVPATTLENKIITKADSRPPGILSNRAVGRVIGRGKDARANLYIKVETDEITTAKVFYSPGIVLNNFEQSSAEDPVNTYHLITIPVDPGQVYSYIVKTFDESGNETSTRAVTVIVEDSKENATEIVVGTFADKFSWVSRLWQ
jgi:hypothetical protein